MSTAENLRVTRSASKARSTGAASTGAASVGASSRGRSRRVGSAAPLAEDDKPALGNQVTRAYGTEGRPAQAHLLSTQIGMSQAINPILTAVSKAQAPETPIANPPERLAALSEELEPNEGRDQPVFGRQPFVIERRPYSIDSSDYGQPPNHSEPATQPSFFSRFMWGPRRNGFNAEGPNRTANDVIGGRSSARTNDLGQPPVNAFPYGSREYRVIYPWSWTVLVRDALLVLVLLFGVIWGYEATRTHLFDFPEDPMSLRIASLLHLRMNKVEQNIQDITIGSTSVDATTAEHQINWFTPGFGAGIDLYLSSPTLSECDPTWTPDEWPWSMLKSQTCPQIPLSAPQYTALSPWTDPVDDAWCAPPSNGKLQLTVVLNRTIAPTELVVEHAAMDEMPVGFMGSSPREVELWIHIPNDRTRAAVREAISNMDPSFLDESSPQGKTIGAQALPFDYVPVGRWEYNIYSKKRLQTFPVHLSLEQYGVRTTRVAVRVNSNWGNVKYTCLNRLRLFGQDTSGATEELEPWPVGMTSAY